MIVDLNQTILEVRAKMASIWVCTQYWCLFLSYVYKHLFVKVSQTCSLSSVLYTVKYTLRNIMSVPNVKRISSLREANLFKQCSL